MLRFSLAILTVSASLAASVGGNQTAQSQGPAKPQGQPAGSAAPAAPVQSRPSPNQASGVGSQKKEQQKKSAPPASREINFNSRTSVSTNRLRLREVDDSALRNDPNLPVDWSATDRLEEAIERAPGFHSSKVGKVNGLDVVLETRVVKSAASVDLEYRIVDARTGQTLNAGVARGQTTAALESLPLAYVSWAELKGVLEHQAGRFYLTDVTSKTRAELRGTDLAKFTGKAVLVTGSVIRGLAPAGGASQVVQVTKLGQLSPQAAMAAGLPAGTGAAGAAAAGAAAAGAAAATGATVAGVGVGSAVAVGVGVAGTIVGILVARKTDAGLGVAAGTGVPVVLVSAILVPKAIGTAVRAVHKAFAPKPMVTNTLDIDDLSNTVASAWGSVSGDLAKHPEAPQPGH